MAPYRTVDHDATADVPRDTGIVGDIIAQFADTLAFYRELVQNSIDAGSPSVEISIGHDGAAAHIEVRDRGEGMTRDIVENQLLVLFRSTKERDDTKIGKFGVGFASVLAPNPELVQIHTARDGRRLTVHLRRDLTYQLFDAGPATHAGTTVELEIAMPIEQARELAERSHQALLRWCRHATVPIRFEVTIAGGPPLATRIDRPLGLDKPLVEVRRTSDDGKLTVVVGLVESHQPYTGFFNHGLTLHETSEPLIGPLAVKIQDSRLGHTLSRDNVRRDESFERAIAFARGVAERELPRRAEIALRELAEEGARERHRALALALIEAKVTLPGSGWWWPLTHPVTMAGEERRSMHLSSAGSRLWGAPRGSRMASAMTSAGMVVFDIDPGDHGWIASMLSDVSGARLLNAETALVHIAPVTLGDDDLVILETIGELLDRCARRPPQIVIASMAGSHDQQLALAGGADSAINGESPSDWIVERETANTNPFSRLRPRTLALRAEHPAVVQARRSADPRLAASHLTRSLLLQFKMLDVDRSAMLLEHSLAKLDLGAAKR